MEQEFHVFYEAFMLTLIANGMNPGLARSRANAVARAGIVTWENLLTLNFDTRHDRFIDAKGIGPKTSKVLRHMAMRQIGEIYRQAYWTLIDVCCREKGIGAVRPFNILHRNRYSNFYALKTTNEEDIQAIKGVGPKILDVILYIRGSEKRFMKYAKAEKIILFQKEERILKEQDKGA